MEVLAVASEVVPAGQDRRAGRCRRRPAAGARRRGLACEDAGARLPGPAPEAETHQAAAALRQSFWRPGAAVFRQRDNLALLVLDAPHLFDRPGGPYGDATGADWPDNALRFAALSRVAADLAGGAVAGYAPALVHAHDWQAGMAPAYMRYLGHAKKIPSVITIHNLAFQGRFPASTFPQLGLPAEAMSVDGVEYYGGIGFLKAGLQAASAVTTVSPTYAQEIRTPEFGMGLDGLVNLRAGDMQGIVNGIDTVTWNPETDSHLKKTFSARTLKAREANKRALETRFGLERGDGPILCVVSRLTWQKGIDILAAALDGIVKRARGLPFWAPATRRWKAQCLPVQRAIAARSASSSVMTRPVASDAGRCGRDCHSLALRTLRPDAALWPALWLRAAGRAHRRPCRYHSRRQ